MQQSVQMCTYMMETLDYTMAMSACILVVKAESLSFADGMMGSSMYENLGNLLDCKLDLRANNAAAMLDSSVLVNSLGLLILFATYNRIILLLPMKETE